MSCNCNLPVYGNTVATHFINLFVYNDNVVNKQLFILNKAIHNILQIFLFAAFRCRFTVF